MSGEELGMADSTIYPILAYMIHRGLVLKKFGLSALQEYVDRCEDARAVREARPEGWEESGKSLFREM